MGQIHKKAGPAAYTTETGKCSCEISCKLLPLITTDLCVSDLHIMKDIKVLCLKNTHQINWILTLLWDSTCKSWFQLVMLINKASSHCLPDGIYKWILYLWMYEVNLWKYHFYVVASWELAWDSFYKMVPFLRLKVTECGYLEAVAFKLFHFVYLFTCFCLKQLLKLEWQLSFTCPGISIAPASNSICKGWLIKQKKRDFRTESASVFSCHGALRPLGIITA